MPLTVAEIARRMSRSHPEGTDGGDGAPAPEPDVGRVMRQLVRALVLGSALDIIDERFPWARDQRLTADPRVPDAERLAASKRLTDSVRLAPAPLGSDRERRAWAELYARAEADERPVSDVMDEILAEALLLVLDTRDRVRRIRVGSSTGSFFLREDDGTPVGVRPNDLPYSADPDVASGARGLFAESPYLYWLRREVQKAAVAILLGDPYPATDGDDDAWGGPLDLLGDDDAVLADDTADPLALLLDRDPPLEDPRLLAVLERATPRQRELLALLVEGGTAAEAARELGMAESTARVQLKRLRDKAV